MSGRSATPTPPLVDWTGWSAARIDGFGADWRSLTSRTLVLRGRGAGMRAPQRRGALTAKFAWRGAEHYQLAGRTLAADDAGWVVIPAGELYASSIASGPPVETLAVFFDESFIAAARAERRTTDHDLLDLDPRRPPLDEPLPAGRRHLAYTPALAAAVRAAATSPEPLARAELLATTLTAILDAAGDAAAERARLPCLRAATRAELHRRLCRAHDLLMSAYATPLDLSRLAAEAAMAPHHFLRRFTDLFGVTPHRALVARRLARARDLLTTTALPVATIATAVGFSSAAAFSTRFRRDTGRAPASFRRAAR